MDIDAVEFGVDYRERIAGALQNTDYVLALIGPRWLGPLPNGQNRIGDAGDPVRMEIETALQFGVRIVPVLLEHAKMPGAENLPESLQRLSYINAAEVTAGRDFDDQIERLVRFIDRSSSGSERQNQESHPNNLPLQLTSFVGREEEVAALTTLIAQHRVVTIVGSGGVGKTRTSIQVATNVLDDFKDGAWFVELAPLNSGEYLPSTIAQALGLTFAPGSNALDTLARTLQPKHALLILDNCEHLVEPAAHLASVLLRSCPYVKVLVSSRRPLDISGEETYRLTSLDVPARETATGLQAQDAIRSAAIKLFVARARAVNKSFELSDDNAATVAEICRRLDGIPLAIELAASRVRMLSPLQLRERLNARFALLTGGSRDALPHQQTLLATIDWSHDLLDARERALFRRLGIFVNGFTLEGAVAVGSGRELDEGDVLEVLSSLLDQSLMQAEPDRDRLRYRFLESTRVYAADKLAESGEHDAVARRHLHYLRDRLAQLNAQVMRTGRVSDFTDVLKTELEDVRAALAGALSRGDFVGGSELTVSIGRFWSFIGLDREETMWNEAFLAVLPDDKHLLRSRLRNHLASNLYDDGQNVRAMEHAEQALQLARASGDLETLGWALKEAAGPAIALGRLDDAEAILAEAENIGGLAAFLRMRLLRLRALLTETRGEYEAATVMYGQVVEEASVRGDIVVKQRALRQVAVMEYRLGHTKRSVAIAREILPTLPSSGDTEERARWLRYLAVFLASDGDPAEAAVAAREATHLFALQGPRTPNVTAAIEVVALLCALQGELVRAAILEGYSDVAFQRESFQREIFAGNETHERLIALLRDQLTPGELTRLLAEGAVLTPEAAVALALEERNVAKS
jgi:predicted ATPase